MLTRRRLLLIIVTTLLALMLFAITIEALEAPALGDFIVVSNQQSGGRPYRVAVSGTLVYVGQDRMVRALDASGPGAPVQAGLAYTLPGSILSLAAEGTRLYAATNGEVYIFSAENPGNLQLLGITTDPYSVHDIAAQGNALYVADGSYGVMAIDVTDPVSPVLSQVAPIPTTLNSLDVAGSLIVVATEGQSQNRVYTLELIDPLHPVVRGSVQIGGPARGVVLRGRYAYASAANADLVNLAVVDVQTPTIPSLVTRITLTGTTSQVMTAGDYVYVTSMLPNGTTALHVVDIHAPAAPLRVGTLTGLGTAPWAANRPGNVFIADAMLGRVYNVDVNVPSAPVLAGIYGGPALARSVAMGDRYAVAADYWNGMSVIDLGGENGRMLPEVGRVAVADLNKSVALSGTQAYLSSSSTGLRIFDLTDPHNPALLGAVDTPGAASGLALRGTHVYIASGDQGLTVVDAANPAQPVVQGTLITPEWIEDVAAGPNPGGPGDVVYAAGFDGFRVIDVSNPAAPVEIGHADTSGNNVKVVLDGTRLYLANTEFGLVIYDVSDPATPLSIGHHLWSGATGVAIDGNYAYLTAGEWPWEGPGAAQPAIGNTGLRVLDITNPAAPVLLGFYHTPGTPAAVAARGGTALVADGAGGIARVRALRVNALVSLPALMR